MLAHIILWLSSGNGLGAVLGRGAESTVVVPAPYSVPTAASPPIDPAFAGFAFEERSFYYYAGNSSNPNSFTQNLIKAITDKTQTKPIIRVGGTSLDHSSYNRSQSQAVVVPHGEKSAGIPTNLSIGPLFFHSFANLPDARYIIDIPLAKNNQSNSLMFAEDAYRIVAPSNIFALEIGNEPNYYAGNVRPGNYTITDYVKQWTNWSSAVSKALGLSSDDKIYEAVTLASETSATRPPGAPGDPWKVPNVFEHGLDKNEARIKSVSMHYYQTKANPESDFQHDLMNHSAVTRGSSFVKAAVQYLNMQHPPIPLALAEVGNVIGNRSDNTPLEAVLGSALWQVDFFLYSMSIGVNRINYQSGDFPFALWTAGIGNTTPAVQASFYGQIFSAEFIGPGRNVRVANVDLKSDFHSAYAAYDDGKLSRIAITNLKYWSRNGTTKRPSQKFTLSLDQSVTGVKVKKLASPGGATASAGQNLTWGGMSWSYGSDGKGVLVVNDTETIRVGQGQKKVEVDVPASEAVMLFLKY